MEPQKTYTIGLHRPFNMPLKSLVWVCRFSKKNKQENEHDFYLDFFLWMMKAIAEHADIFDEQKAEGIVTPKNAKSVLALFANCCYEEVKEKVRATLLGRISDDDKLIYSSYKNTSYYITLTKKVNFIDGRGNLTSLGKELANVRDYHFFYMADKQKQIIFRALCCNFLENLVIIIQSLYFIKGDRGGEDAFFRAYLKRYENVDAIKYVTSFDKNYLEVLRHWINTLNLCNSFGTIRKKYLVEIDNLGLTRQYESIVHNTEIFFSEEFKNKIRLEQQYDRIRNAYANLLKKGLSEFGYVNLYDIKKKFRLSYESFNKLLNSYYATYRHIEIILFSNTVSSIDTRRRFLVTGNAVLKIRIIKKS